MAATPLVTLVLDAFSKPKSASAVARSLSALGSAAVKQIVSELGELGFLVPATTSAYPRDVSAAWSDCFAAAYFHFTTRDVVYAQNPFEWFSAAGPRLTATECPSVFKEYKRARFRKLPKSSKHDASLEGTLRNRRTVRAFLQAPVAWRALARVIEGTWGKTGVFETGILGSLLAKTSPSAGARHPIECYLIAWNVEGLEPGLYHYSVRRNGVECLRRGDLRREAIQAASGQEWVGEAAFLCVLTVVVERVFWKYPSPDSYRLFFLDAGHIAQTFCLLATAAGLGPFTTAAIQETYIERLLRIDGVMEFPIYLCGAGTADASRSIFESIR